jgi:scyllo-inositol 2-dehydrogenase (NADP+)
MDQPNVAVVGYGFAGSCFHSYLVSICPDLRLHSIVSTRDEARQQARARFGVQTYARVTDALDDPAVDLIVLATPNDFHAPLAIQALEAGKHVVTDKPMALTLAEADAMIDASRRHGRLLSVFQNRRWDGDFLTVRQVLNEGLLGQPFLFELFWGGYGQPRGWRSSAAQGGGRLFDLGAHMIDQALQLVASPCVRVFCRLRTDLFDTDVDDHAHCIISFADGTDVHVSTSSLACIPKPRWYVLGTQGSLVKYGLDPQEAAMIAGDIDAAEENPEQYARINLMAAGGPEEMTMTTVPGRWRSFYENIGATLRGEAELAVTPESVRSVLAVIEAARRSAALGGSVSLAAPAAG